MSISPRRHPAAGFTLIETVLFIIIVGIAAGGITLLFVQNIQSSPEPLLRQKAVAIATAYMDEILRRRWDELTPAGGGCITTATFGCAPRWQAERLYAVGDRVQPTTYAGHVYSVTAATLTRRSGSSEPSWPTNDDPLVDGHLTWQRWPPPAVTIGPESAEVRATFDDIDDYHGLNDAPPQSANGTTMSDSSNFSVAVTVEQVAFNDISANDSKRISVSVTNPLGEVITLVAWRVNY
jgi:Tfp pilus assembly protein PilV